MKEIFVFGGPDGAGKTTMAARLLPRHLGVIEFGGDRMTELTSDQLVEVILRGLAEARADLKERDRLLEGLYFSPANERAMAGLTADEVAQVIRDLSSSPSR